MLTDVQRVELSPHINIFLLLFIYCSTLINSAIVLLSLIYFNQVSAKNQTAILSQYERLVLVRLPRSDLR